MKYTIYEIYSIYKYTIYEIHEYSTNIHVLHIYNWKQIELSIALKNREEIFTCIFYWHEKVKKQYVPLLINVGFNSFINMN